MVHLHFVLNGLLPFAINKGYIYTLVLVSAWFYYLLQLKKCTYTLSLLVGQV